MSLQRSFVASKESSLQPVGDGIHYVSLEQQHQQQGAVGSEKIDAETMKKDVEYKNVDKNIKDANTSLYERLQKVKEDKAKQQESEVASEMARIRDEDVAFLQKLEKEKMEQENKIREQESIELNMFKHARAKAHTSASHSQHKKPIQVLKKQKMGHDNSTSSSESKEIAPKDDKQSAIVSKETEGLKKVQSLLSYEDDSSDDDGEEENNNLEIKKHKREKDSDADSE